MAPTCFFLMINGSPARRRTFLAGHSVALLAFLLHFWASFLRGICHFSRMTHLKTNNWERVIKIGISMAIINRKFLEFYSKFRHENARFHPKNVVYYAARVRDTAVYNSQLVCLSFGHITAIHWAKDVSCGLESRWRTLESPNHHNLHSNQRILVYMQFFIIR